MTPTSPRLRGDLSKLWIAALAITALHFGQAVLMPLALAMLVAFALAPLVDRVERWRVGRVPAVVVVCLLIASFVGGIGWVVAREAATLADDVPRYRSIAREKVRDLRGPIGSLSGAATELEELGATIDPAHAAPAPKVEVVQKLGPIAAARDFLAPLLGPIGTIGLVAVLALFMLLAREDLRDRMIWLAGAGDLSVTTRALDDAAARVSRYLAMQTLVNAMHGVSVALGLLVIGVPGAVLWGALSMLLRYVPYFGPWVAAAAPVSLSIVAFSGWDVPLLTIGLFVTLELVSNNVLEPWLYGTSVGLSPFGVVFSAVFWAWLWGVPGLLVATPLTVCLVVAGRYVRSFEVFAALLGDQPALPIDVRLYQRLLALDLDEAADVLRTAAAEHAGPELGDRVVLPVLRRLAEDDRRDTFPDATTDEARERLADLLGDVPVDPLPSSGPRARVLFAPALDECDALASVWLARRARGVEPVFASPHALASEIVEQAANEKVLAVCVSALTPRAAAQALHLCKRLERAGVACDRIVGTWAAPMYARRATDGDVAWIATERELDAALQSVRARAPATPALRVATPSADPT